jgi:hypothetical protein
MKIHISLARFLCHHRLAIPAAGLLAVTLPAWAQIPPDTARQLQEIVGSRVETAVVLGGDYGVSGGKFETDNDVDINITKFGGKGDIGAPRPIGDSGLKWQPRVLGNAGYLTAERDFDSGVLDGDESEYKTLAIMLGGGARFWFNEHLSLAPTISAMYGHTENEFTARSAFSQTNFAAAKAAGLVDYHVDTWTIRPGAELSYGWNWERVVIQLTSDFGWFHTEDFDSTSDNISIDGDSYTWQNKIDVDVPLGAELFNCELHTGGFFSRTDFFGDIGDEGKLDHLYEAHGRLVLDTTGKLWKVSWIGLGFSYLWGNNFDGYSAGVDVRFNF